MIPSIVLLFMLTIPQIVGIPTARQEEAKATVIIIDPGHGGIDGGTQSPDGNVLEKDINLSLARQLARRLQSDGLQVALTRSEDTDVTEYAPKDHGWGRHKRDLFGRVETVRRYPSVLMVSLHGNHGTSANRGAIVFYNPASVKSYLLAGEMQNRLNAVTGTGGSPKKGNAYYILKRSSVPTVLVEYGYLSNSAEVSRLLDPTYQQQIVDAVRQGICNYLAVYHS